MAQVRRRSVLLVLAIATLVFTHLTPVQAQQVPDPQQFRSLEQETSTLSLDRAEQLMTEADQALELQDYERAITLLQDAFEAFNARSNYHQQLASSFSGIDNRITEAQRESARQAAELRDQAAYDLAIVYRAAAQPEEAVAQLVQVVASQNPTRPLGAQAYQQLLEIGFVSTPFPS